jgi:hypothetical protein
MDAYIYFVLYLLPPIIMTKSIFAVQHIRCKSYLFDNFSVCLVLFVFFFSPSCIRIIRRKYNFGRVVWLSRFKRQTRKPNNNSKNCQIMFPICAVGHVIDPLDFAGVGYFLLSFFLFLKIKKICSLNRTTRKTHSKKFK